MTEVHHILSWIDSQTPFFIKWNFYAREHTQNKYDSMRCRFFFSCGIFVTARNRGEKNACHFLQKKMPVLIRYGKLLCELGKQPTRYDENFKCAGTIMLRISIRNSLIMCKLLEYSMYFARNGGTRSLKLIAHNCVSFFFFWTFNQNRSGYASQLRWVNSSACRSACSIWLLFKCDFW